MEKFKVKKSFGVCVLMKLIKSNDKSIQITENQYDVTSDRSLKDITILANNVANKYGITFKGE